MSILIKAYGDCGITRRLPPLSRGGVSTYCDCGITRRLPPLSRCGVSTYGDCGITRRLPPLSRCGVSTYGDCGITRRLPPLFRGGVSIAIVPCMYLALIHGQHCCLVTTYLNSKKYFVIFSFYYQLKKQIYCIAIFLCVLHLMQ